MQAQLSVSVRLHAIAIFDDQDLRCALEGAIAALREHLPHIGMLTYAGMEGGHPVLEANAGAHLPAMLETGGALRHVLVRRVDDPVGCVLYAS